MRIPRDWTFKNRDIARDFDRHVREQLPWYDLTTGVIAHIARHYIPEGGIVYDIGASTGNIGRAISDVLNKRKATFIPIDNSPEMASKYSGPGKLQVVDATFFDFEPFDLAICFLVLMFIKPSERARFLSKLKAKIKPGGAIVIFDKCIPVSGYIATVMWRLALAGKIAAGIEAKEVLAKELSLAGVQRPLDPSELQGAIEIFRFGDFAGWILEYLTPTKSA